MKTDESLSKKYQIAAQAIRVADGLRIVAGAGMGTDSGLPYFDWFNVFSKNRSGVCISREAQIKSKLSSVFTRD